jgi:serine protease AprX
MLKRIFFLTFFGSCYFMAAAQSFHYTKYWVAFTDKNNSPFSINNPQQFLSAKAIDNRSRQNIAIDILDLPVNPHYVDSVVAVGATVLHKSKWMNAITIELTDTLLLPAISQLSFVKAIEPVYGTRIFKAENDEATQAVVKLNDSPELGSDYYGEGYNQIYMLRGDYLHHQGYNGEGITIGVLDSGFGNADIIEAFQHLFNENRILATWDFVTNNSSVFEDDGHGTNVLSTMAANIENSFVGTAPKANYLLFRTEDAGTEFRVEEDNWVAAVEMADSIGVDVINTSLGYSDFDDPSMDYTYADMNGKTTRITQGAQWAARKGIVVINSAGNSGNNSWRYITAPADADSILAVGAVNNVGSVANFSSRGPSADGRVKPDIVAQGAGTTVVNTSGEIRKSNGTSFSSPVLAGMAACFRQAFPQKNNIEIINAIRASAHLYHTPNDSAGYGIPDFRKAYIINAFSAEKLLPHAYPNPFGSRLNISFLSPVSETYEVTLYDYFGKEIATATQYATKGDYVDFTFNDTENLAAGLYIAKIKSEFFTDNLRVLKH